MKKDLSGKCLLKSQCFPGFAGLIAHPPTESDCRRFSIGCDGQVRAGQRPRQPCLEKRTRLEKGMRVSVTNVTSQFLYNSEESRPPPALASHARYWNLGKIVLTTPVRRLDWPRFGGVVAQLVERLNGIQEVRGSNPLGSTSQSVAIPCPFRLPKSTVWAARNVWSAAHLQPL